MKLLFITRKYPSKIGGMESFSAGLFNHLKVDKELIALKYSQVHLFWFIPYAFIKALFSNYDLLYISDGALAFLGVLLKKIKRKPIAITVHGLDIIYPKPWYQWLNVKRFKTFDKVIAVSQNTKKLALEKKVPKKNIEVIPNGIDKVEAAPKFPKPKNFLESKLKINLSEKKVLLTVGRVIRRKGVFWFTKNVIPKLDKNLVYCVVGNGPEKEIINDIITQLKLDHKVFILDNIGSDDLKKIYQEADIFVMPNIKVENDVEGFGIVAAEAASHGLPVVASDIEGIKDVVTENIGIRVPEKDIQAFEDAINDLVEGSEKLQKKSINAFEEANCLFSWDRIAKKYEKLLSCHCEKR